MKVIIAGCGRVGSLLAVALADDGVDVTVIDAEPEAFTRLPDDFAGQVLRGIVFDRATLEIAGIERADVFVAVTSGDNSNIVSARTARERYGVPHVVARIADPIRAEIYRRFDVHTVAAAEWTVDEIRRTFARTDECVQGPLVPGSRDVVVLTVTVPPGADGVSVDSLRRPGRWEVAAITSDHASTVPVTSAVVGAGDMLHLSVERSAVDAARQAVAALGAKS